jgi:DNA-binding NarL/FixJ family response regulator/mRNA-degrading endonuclease RelE of RelBE toxin-antitoxin system
MSERKPRWEIVLTRQAEKTLYRLSKNLLQPIDQALLALAENPRPPESRPLPGYENLYRLPVVEWRVTYTVEDERLTVLVLEIAPKQQPEPYRLEEELDKDFSPGPSPPPDQTVVPPITELRPQPLSGLEGDFLYRAPGLLKRLRKEKIRLLIGDHVQESRENLRKQLFGEADIEIVGMAANEEEAIQIAVKQQPDIVLLDTHLSDIGSFTACERIVQQVPAAQIIMMSAGGTEEYVRQAMRAGAKEFLIKPFSGLELAVSIRRVYRSTAWQRLADTRAASYHPNAFNDLKERLQARLMSEFDPTMDVSRPEEVRQLIQDRFERILAQENIILSRSERERLFEATVAAICGFIAPSAKVRSENAQWYMIFSHSGHEEKVQKNLLHRIEALGMQDKIFEVVVPINGATPSKVSPGAILVEMLLDEDSWNAIKNTPGVTGFFGSDDRPMPLPPDEISRILERG